MQALGGAGRDVLREGRLQAEPARPLDHLPGLRDGAHRVRLGRRVHPEARDHCRLRANCTAASAGTGRTVAIAENERLQHRLRKLQKTRSGPTKLRERVAVEHRQAHLARRQGRRARNRRASGGEARQLPTAAGDDLA
jgi:hypothetical protein